MSLVIPDLIIANTINLALEAIRDDYNTRVLEGFENRSVLYLMFNGLTLGKYNLYNNVKSLIITTPQNPKHIEARTSFNHSQGATVPYILVTLPGENDRNNSLGLGAGNNDELTFWANPDEYKEQFERRFSATYQILIAAENRNEVLVLYNVIKAILVLTQYHLILEGLENIKIGGQDININPQVPEKLFIKAVTMNFEYSQVFPELSFQDIVREIRLYWKADGSVTRRGPITFSNEDDIDSDSDS